MCPFIMGPLGPPGPIFIGPLGPIGPPGPIIGPLLGSIMPPPMGPIPPGPSSKGLLAKTVSPIMLMSPGRGWLTGTEVFWLVLLFFLAFPPCVPPPPPTGHLNPPDITH